MGDITVIWKSTFPDYAAGFLGAADEEVNIAAFIIAGAAILWFGLHRLVIVVRRRAAGDHPEAPRSGKAGAA